MVGKIAIVTTMSIGIAFAVAAADAPPSPTVTLNLGPRHGHVTPCRQGFTHTGGGNIDVSQASADVLVITMSGVAVAGGHPTKNSIASLNFDLDQTIDVVAADGKAQRAKLSLEGRIIGALRSHRHGGGQAQHGPACAFVTSGNVMFNSLTLANHSVACGDNNSLNCREGPIERTVATGVRYNLKQTFQVSASHPSSFWPCKAASAEFAPDPALDPLWISYWEPFHGVSKKDFGFQVSIRVAPE